MRRYLNLVVIAALGVGLTHCGDDKRGDKNDEQTTNTEPSPAPSDEGEGKNVVEDLVKRINEALAAEEAAEAEAAKASAAADTKATLANSPKTTETEPTAPTTLPPVVEDKPAPVIENENKPAPAVENKPAASAPTTPTTSDEPIGPSIKEKFAVIIENLEAKLRTDKNKIQSEIGRTVNQLVANGRFNEKISALKLALNEAPGSETVATLKASVCTQFSDNLQTHSNLPMIEASLADELCTIIFCEMHKLEDIKRPFNLNKRLE